ncbi:MAG: Aminotransferase, DegT/DnrJ/EryC1/StrS family [uncultured Acidimicrobiales bacterium]|uniref:Aminotransferase, DegT/DnrJ/EryC1/StrS family n=1 Tax=uncultured Acidimicrobiales bacterium TaxID=310071 RepID=A0A6J4IWC7_9ACTN|nr:MAG: Aminotransferase, DegT/DnrJ/EryC1/StrS family [uncultured Acidimicrobiales bacterium]
MTRTLRDLALFGGAPLATTPLHVGAPNIGDRQRLHELLDDALDRRWLTNDGPFVQAFERRVADLVEVEHCVATSSATTGLMLLAACLGLRGEVVLPALTFVATPHAMRWQGLSPVFADVDRATLTLSPASAAAACSSETSAVLGVHLWGTPCDVDGLTRLTAERSCALVFDAAHALGSIAGGRPVGSSGEAEVFSFHATKLCNAFEGGAVATNDARLAAALAEARNFGFAGEDEISGLGINAKMSEVSAAMGLVSLDALDHFVHAHRTNHEHYRVGLAGGRGVTLRDPDSRATPTRPYVVIEVEDEAGLSRDELLAVLRAENVLARRYFFPGCHRVPPYRDDPRSSPVPLPVTEQVLDRVLVLPTGTATSTPAIDRICEVVRCALEHPDEVRAQLATVAR